jgi:hypothetical protein
MKNNHLRIAAVGVGGQGVSQFPFDFSFVVLRNRTVVSLYSLSVIRNATSI